MYNAVYPLASFVYIASTPYAGKTYAGKTVLRKAQKIKDYAPNLYKELTWLLTHMAYIYSY